MSKDVIKKFLEDTANHPDTTTVRIGDQEVPLGSLRALNSDERQQVADGIKANAERESELNQQRNKVVDLAQKAQAAYSAAQEAQQKAAAGNANSTPNPFETDTWLQPVDKRFIAAERELSELKKKHDQTLTALATAANIFAEDRYEREYERLNFGKREKKPTRDEILKFATDNKIVDRLGMPSISNAWNKMSEGDRLEEIRQEALEQGRAEGRAQQNASRMPPPGVPGPGMSGGMPKPPSAKDGDLGDLYQDALKDPELRKLVEDMGPQFVQ